VVDCASLVSEYRRIFNLDISRFVASHQEIALYKCNQSGYRFYHPADVVGDSAFYHHLEANDWYYAPTKWEFDETLRFVQKGTTILEIGSARGDFLNRVQCAFPDVSCTGLELNEDAARVAQVHGFPVVIESSSEHARSRPSHYDVVACFQMLEHIPRPVDVLKDAIAMLKPGGLLIIGVPDNSERSSPSIFVTSENILNMPPHHQGLWDIPSLAFLQKVLPLKLEYMAVEPATASHHSNSYRGLMKTDLVRRWGPVFGLALYLAGRPFYNHALRHLRQYLPAHSLFAVFKRDVGR